MAKYKFGAHIICIDGGYRESKTLEFIADEELFFGTQTNDQLKSKALRLAKSQNRNEVSRFKKVEISDSYKGDKVDSSSKKNRDSSRKRYKTKTSPTRSLFSYNIFLIPFVLIWRILKLFF